MPRHNPDRAEPPPLAVSPADIPKPAPPVQRRRIINPEHAARLKREQAERDALADLRQCAWPTCTKAPTFMGGRLLPFCAWHALETWAAVQDAEDDRPEITDYQLNRRVERERAERREAEQQASRGVEPGWVYYVRVTDRIKIGFSTDVRQRMRAYPPHAELLAVHPGTPTLEHEIHRDLAGHLAQGREWFRPDTEVMAHIDEVLADFGPPPRKFIYRFRDGTQQRIRVHRRSRT